MWGSLGRLGDLNGVGASGIHPPKAGAQEQQPLWPPQVHICFIYIFSSITKVNLISSLHQGFSSPA